MVAVADVTATACSASGMPSCDMMKRLPELERRRRATEATRAKYIGTAFDWKRWRHCIALARFQAVQMGHRPPPIRAIRGPISAKRELAKRNCETVIELLDGQFARIAPAEMLLGDIAAFPGTDGLNAIGVCAGPGRVLCWREDHPVLAVLVVDLDQLEASWRL